MPSYHTKSNGLIQAARAMRSTAATFESVFVEHGSPADFLAQVDEAIAALAGSVMARSTAVNRGVTATTSLREDLALGTRLTQSLNAAMLHALSSDPALMASWRQAKHVRIKGVAGTPAIVTPIPPSCRAPHRSGKHRTRRRQPLPPANHPRLQPSRRRLHSGEADAVGVVSCV